MTSGPAIYGNFTIDDLVYPNGSTRWGVPGGSAVYAAMGALLWTKVSSIVAPLGADYPITLLDKRIDLSRCRSIPKTMRNWGLYEEDGRRHFISRNESRDWTYFSPALADAASGYQAAAHIAPLPFEATKQLIEELRAGGTKSISLDMDDHDLLGNRSLKKMMELVSTVDLFMPSQQDVLALFPGKGPLEAMHQLRSLVPEVALIAIKCGAGGTIAHLAGSEEYLRIPAVHVEVIDQTGAGDAFCGGVLGSLARQGDLLEALLCGAVSASFCIEGMGFSSLLEATGEAANSRLERLRQRVERAPCK
ncbi:carbohydrate kinase family protein [Terriglobus saanensis]|uniref:PfkB domain protein n=1 Tax=Terriglobus saanensis (strain ATCC BAA-1853 / DSM 23119 / SP1PR4) TaxID=401053 RepID=E8V3K5_TERSS|nr:PfkB family carbohydrate kinase [Terriglobus saanensis]ADV83618.1 PfkB domain protein [Terriglobus saanensis SP1PR4]